MNRCNTQKYQVKQGFIKIRFTYLQRGLPWQRKEDHVIIKVLQVHTRGVQSRGGVECGCWISFRVSWQICTAYSWSPKVLGLLCAGSVHGR